jgi:hypothetical protein
MAYRVHFLLQVQGSLDGVESTLPVISRGLGNVLLIRCEKNVYYCILLSIVRTFLQ